MTPLRALLSSLNRRLLFGQAFDSVPEDVDQKLNHAEHRYDDGRNRRVDPRLAAFHDAKDVGGAASSQKERCQRRHESDDDVDDVVDEIRIHVSPFKDMPFG